MFAVFAGDRERGILGIAGADEYRATRIACPCRTVSAHWNAASSWEIPAASAALSLVTGRRADQQDQYLLMN